MAGPTWLSLSLAVLMVGTSIYCAGRLVVSKRRGGGTQHDVDSVHVVMGVVMAGMLAGALSFGSSGLWEVFFAVTAAWFGWVVSSCGGAEKPGLFSKLGGTSLDARQGVAGPRHNDDLVVQERLAGQVVG